MRLIYNFPFLNYCQVLVSRFCLPYEVRKEVLLFFPVLWRRLCKAGVWGPCLRFGRFQEGGRPAESGFSLWKVFADSISLMFIGQFKFFISS